MKLLAEPPEARLPEARLADAAALASLVEDRRRRHLRLARALQAEPGEVRRVASVRAGAEEIDFALGLRKAREQHWQ